MRTIIRSMAATGFRWCRARHGRRQAQHATAGDAAKASPAALKRAKPAPSPEEKAIIDGVEAFAQVVFERANAEALAELFLRRRVDHRSRRQRDPRQGGGRRDVRDGVPSEPRPEGRNRRSRRSKFLTPDVARVMGQSQLSSATGDASEFNRFSALLVRRDGKWRIAEIREYAAPPADVTPYERLQELEWMVGDWVDESDNNRVQSSVRWADNQSYLVRTYKIEIQGEKGSSGTMFIGWDPQSGQIKSWLFDSNGGHGEGLWTRTGEKEWVVKAQGVLRDGRPTSATQIHTSSIKIRSRPARSTASSAARSLPTSSTS